MKIHQQNHDAPLTQPGSNPDSWDKCFEQWQHQSRDRRLRAYYAQGIVRAVTPIGEVPLVAMDFETTGLDPRKNDILSIGLIPFSLQRIYCREARHWLLKPADSLSEESVVIHGITHADVGSAPALERILDELLVALSGKVVVVHYRQIERAFLSEALLRQLGENIRFPVIDTFELERRAMEARRGWIGKLLGKPLGSLRLGDARFRYSLPPYQPHHALTDALSTAELLQAQIAHHYRPDSPVGALWC